PWRTKPTFLSYDAERVGRCLLSLAMKATPSTGKHAEMQFPSLQIGGVSRQEVPCHQHHSETSTSVAFAPSKRTLSDGSNRSAKGHFRTYLMEQPFLAVDNMLEPSNPATRCQTVAVDAAARAPPSPNTTWTRSEGNFSNQQAAALPSWS